jgi:hypothetical protein
MTRWREKEGALLLCEGERAGLDYPCDSRATVTIKHRCNGRTFAVCGLCAQELRLYGFKVPRSKPQPQPSSYLPRFRDPCPND